MVGVIYFVKVVEQITLTPLLVREHARLEFLFALHEGRIRLKAKHMLSVVDSGDQDSCELTKLLSVPTRKRYL